MSLNLPENAKDLFAPTSSSPQLPTVPEAKAPTTTTTGGGITLGGIFSAVLRDDPEIKKQMTPAEQSAVAAVIKNVGTPDEYGSAAEYIMRALPYVKAVYSALDVILPGMPTNEEIAILMRSRFL